jgi:hypothetical protein
MSGPLICADLAGLYLNATLDMLFAIYFPIYSILSMASGWAAHYLFAYKWRVFAPLRLLIVVVYLGLTMTISYMITIVTLSLWSK